MAQRIFYGSPFSPQSLDLGDRPRRRGRATRPRRFVNGSILRSVAADRTSSTNETGKLISMARPAARCERS